MFCILLAWLPGVALALETRLSAPGIPEDIQEQLRDASATLAAETRGLTTPQELLAAALSDYRTLVQVLYDSGYFSPVVRINVDGREAASIPPLSPPSSVRKIEIEVAAGPAFRFGTARVAPLAGGTELPEGFRSGLPASTGLIRDAAAAGITGWRQAGFAKASVGEQRIVATHARAVLDADITLLPGRQLTFGTLSLTNPSAVRAEAIQRIAGFPTGAVFDPEEVRKVATRLRRTGAFSSVSLREAAAANPDGTLDFAATLVDQKPRRISFGVELSTGEGLDLLGKWMHRNLFGNAERLRLEARVRNIGGSEDIDGQFSVRLDQPASLGPDDNLFYLAALESLDEPHYTLNRIMAGAGVRRVFSDELFAELAVTGGISDAEDAFGNRTFNMLALPFLAEWDKRDDPLNPTRGLFLNGKITPFAGFSGTKSGMAMAADLRGYLRLSSSGSVVLAGRLQLGTVLGPSHPDISPEFLYFSGGAGTVRGQPYQSLGIPVGTGLAGGRSLLASSAELRGRITEKLSLVGFYDFGAVDSGAFATGASRSHSGAGIGVRYDLGGLGPLRLDLALPASGGTGDGLQFYLGIGQTF